MQLQRGQFPYVDIEALPNHYITQLVGGTADIKWSDLTEDEKVAVAAENKRRQAATDALAVESDKARVKAKEEAETKAAAAKKEHDEKRAAAEKAEVEFKAKVAKAAAETTLPKPKVSPSR